MPLESPIHPKTYIDLALFGLFAIAASIIVELFVKSGFLVGTAPGLAAAGLFLMITGTSYFFFTRLGNFRFPDSMTYFSIIVIIAGGIITYFLIEAILPFAVMLVSAPLVIVYGLSILALQLYVRYRFSIRLLFISSSAIIIAGGLVLYASGMGTYITSFSALGIILILSGVYLPMVPAMIKSYSMWKRWGYFNGPDL